jgi:hypothetical protein
MIQDVDLVEIQFHVNGTLVFCTEVSCVQSTSFSIITLSFIYRLYRDGEAQHASIYKQDFMCHIIIHKPIH